MNYRLEETLIYLDKVGAGYGNPTDSDFKLTIKDITICEKNVVRDGVAATGQAIAIVGRSGRGKSTLFKVLTGLLKPAEGKVLITNHMTEDVSDAKEVEEGDVGFVDQKYTLFRHKTITQIFKYALRKKNLPAAEQTEIINRYLIEWGLEQHKDKYPNELSGGQRQRTAIVEQILSSGHFMIFDEPFSGLDVGNIQSVKKAFNLIHEAHELNTVIFSTHDIELAVELADSIYVVGFPEGTTDYSTIVKHYDLKELGLAWQELTPRHFELVKDIKETMLKS